MQCQKKREGIDPTMVSSSAFRTHSLVSLVLRTLLDYVRAQFFEGEEIERQLRCLSTTVGTFTGWLTVEIETR